MTNQIEGPNPTRKLTPRESLIIRLRQLRQDLDQALRNLDSKSINQTNPIDDALVFIACIVSVPSALATIFVIYESLNRP